ncbi:MAG: ATP-binding protein [Candidatus Nitrosotenuis sp.]
MTKTANIFQKAQRARAKARIGISGPSGSGKTYSSLAIATGLGKKIALIDTENGSASLYADKFEFDVAELTSPYTPEKFISYIDLAEKAGYDVIIVDSLSHAWRGEGGILEIHNRISESLHNSLAAWREVSPMHNRLVEKIIQSPAHIITTFRSRQEYVVIEDDSGKKMVKKVGMAPIFKDGIEYEFTIFFELTHEHLAVVSKDRTDLFANQPPFIPARETGAILKEWLESGVDEAKRANPEYYVLMAQIDELEQLKDINKPALFAWYTRHEVEIESLPDPLKKAVKDRLTALKNRIVDLSKSKVAKEKIA